MSPADLQSWIRANPLATLVPTASLPSLFTRVTGEAKVSNWWSHPRGGDVFNASELLADNPDVRVVRLAAGKLTFLHRSLWSALFGVVRNEGFTSAMVSSLGAPDRLLLAAVGDHGRIRMDALVALEGLPDRKDLAKSRKKLSERLLIFDELLHTKSGKHELVLMTWRRAPFDGTVPLPYAQAKAALKAALADAPSVLDRRAVP